MNKNLDDDKNFSRSICDKVHGGLHLKTRGRAEAILARSRMNGGIELTHLEKFELENVASRRKQ